MEVNGSCIETKKKARSKCPKVQMRQNRKINALFGIKCEEMEYEGKVLKNWKTSRYGSK